MVEARDVHRGGDGDIKGERIMTVYNPQHQHSSEKRLVDACELRVMMNTRD